MDNTEVLVDERCACPDCGESRMDWLPWDEAEDLVECATCGCRYDPAEEAK